MGGQLLRQSVANDGTSNALEHPTELDPGEDAAVRQRHRHFDCSDCLGVNVWVTKMNYK